MKLRIRSSNTKETIRVEIPSSSSLRDLKNLIACRLTSEIPSSASLISPDAVHLSLNRTEELPDETLGTLGIASGDLLFYTLGDSRFSPPSSSIASGSSHTRPMEEDFVGDKTESDQFLKRIAEGMKGREATSSEFDILVSTVHAVFLESGFAEHRFHTSEASTVSISYNLLEVANPNFPAPAEEVLLKIVGVGKYAVFYGHLIGDSKLHRICLDASKFSPSIVSCIKSGSSKDKKPIFDLWRSIKDELSFPLLINLCYRKELPLPPCFVRLPAELKVQILELLPGVDLARAACVNSELRFLSANENLWKQKFTAEFSSTETGGSKWKDQFAACWENQKRRRIFPENVLISRYGVSPLRRRDRAQFPAPAPNVIGGDYDLFPAFGSAFPGRSRQYITDDVRRRRGFTPHCYLGGFNA